MRRRWLWLRRATRRIGNKGEGGKETIFEYFSFFVLVRGAVFAALSGVFGRVFDLNPHIALCEELWASAFAFAAECGMEQPRYC